MDPTRLRQFLKIVELGSLTEAARAIHLTQPALSRSLQQLELDLGVELFNRQGRGLALSAAGRALVPRAQAVLEIAERASREVTRAAERAYFDVRVGAIDSVATQLLPNALDHVLSNFERLSVKLVTSRTPSLLQRARRNEIDVALIAHSGAPPHCDATLIARYELGYYGRRDRYPELSKVRKPDELVRFPIVEIEPPPGTPGLVPEGSKTLAHVSNVATVKAMVLAGVGVGDLPDYMLTASERRLLVRAAVEHDPSCGIFLVQAAAWHGDVENTISKAFVDAVRNEMNRQKKSR